MLTQELKATQGTSAMFLVKYETTERERARLYEDLHAHQAAAIREREVEHTRHTMDMDKATQEFGKKIDQLIAETKAQVKTMVTSYDIITGKLRLKVEEAQRENQALHTLQAEREDHINALVMKQR